ncbi:unnamed protein product, partial [Hapterophycus canaliculatus]
LYIIWSSSSSSSSYSPSSSTVASWYCWYSDTRSFMFDSASVNSISSMPSPVYLIHKTQCPPSCNEKSSATCRALEYLMPHRAETTHLPKKTHQWRKAFLRNMAVNCSATRFHTSWMAVVLPTKVVDIL